MKGGAAILWLALIGSTAFGMFQLKLAVQRSETRLAQLDRDLRASRQAIEVLEAEWTYLNRPERLARLAERHLALRPMTPEQVGGLDRLPLVAAMGGAQ